MSSHTNADRVLDNLPPYTIAGGHEYPPNSSPPIAAPIPKAQHSYGLAPNAKGDGTEVDVRQLMGTPSPTPSEKYVLTHKSRSCDLKKTFDFKGNPRQILSVALVLAVIVLLILFLVYQHRIEEWLRPFAEWMHDTPGGWLIPIAIMFVLSFPPLFGHEIVAVLCGDVWGVGIGFGIVAAGTIIGELANFYAFKYWCKARGKKMEETQLRYALLAQVVRDGGFKIPVIMRLSLIPGHLLTAIFSTLGMTLWTFLGAAVLGLPKQLAMVYIGVSSSSPGSAKTTKIIKAAVIAVTGLVTYFSMRYIYRKMDEVKESVVYKRRKARQMKMLAAAGYAADGALPKALDADLERAAHVDVDVVHMNSVTSMSMSATNGTGAAAYRCSPDVMDPNQKPNPNQNQNPNAFGSSRDTVASTATAQRPGSGSRGLDARFHAAGQMG